MANRKNAPSERGWSGPLTLLVLSLGLTAGFYYVLWHYVPADSLLVRYTAAHWVEYIEVWMFLWGLLVLAAKAWDIARQRRAFARPILPQGDGTIPVAEAEELRKRVDALPSRTRDSLLARRVRSGLEFVTLRQSTDGLDEHLRSQSDADANAVEGSYALIKFITWAIPILGFLGTVLGITEAIANVTPEQLAKSITGVTDGLAIAFDTTAIALMFSMVHMFFSFALDRSEQKVLTAVDAYVEERLAHRFERINTEAGEVVGYLDKTSRMLVASSETLVKRQSELWQRSFEEVRGRIDELEWKRQEQLSVGLARMLEQTMHTHEQRLLKMENQVRNETLQMVPHFEKMGAAVNALSRAVDQQAAKTAEQARMLAGLLDGEKQILRLQETLNLTLQTLAQVGTFEQAIHSLTAAIHLMTARSEGAVKPSIVLPAPGSLRNAKGQAA